MFRHHRSCGERFPAHQNDQRGRGAHMPLIDVTYAETVPEGVLRGLASVLPEIVSEAVACPEEPRTGPLAAGDIEIRFHGRMRASLLHGVDGPSSWYALQLM